VSSIHPKAKWKPVAMPTTTIALGGVSTSPAYSSSKENDGIGILKTTQHYFMSRVCDQEASNNSMAIARSNAPSNQKSCTQT
jgi:hypothetical protein